MTYLVNSVDNLHQGSAIQSHDLLNDTSRYDRYLERVANHDKYYIRTGFPELDNIIGGLDRENENMVIAARTGIGKTWTLLIMAAAAVQQGLRVGIYSGEMSVDKLLSAELIIILSLVVLIHQFKCNIKIILKI